MTQLASDDFDRADGGLGANWATTTDYTAILIASNEAEAQASAVCGGRYTATSAPDDGYSEIVVGSVVCTVSDEGIGPAYRISASAGTFYLVQTNTTETRLYRVVNASSYTQLGSDGAACVTGDVLRLTCNGTSISVQRNGTTFIGPVTDATIASGSAGMWAAAGASQGTAASWAFGDLNVAGVAIEESPLASRRNRPGRGPYSLGRYFRARVDAYADPAAAATGQLSQSIGTIELSAQGELSLTATLSEPIGAITLSSASTLTITGTASGSIGTIALSAQGALDITAVLSQPIGAITLSAQGSSGTTGTLSQSIGTITLGGGPATDCGIALYDHRHDRPGRHGAVADCGDARGDDRPHHAERRRDDDQWRDRPTVAVHRHHRLVVRWLSDDFRPTVSSDVADHAHERRDALNSRIAVAVHRADRYHGARRRTDRGTDQDRRRRRAARSRAPRMGPEAINDQAKRGTAAGAIHPQHLPGTDGIARDGSARRRGACPAGSARHKR